jgi:hypothetical protein
MEKVIGSKLVKQALLFCFLLFVPGIFCQDTALVRSLGVKTCSVLHYTRVDGKVDSFRNMLRIEYFNLKGKPDSIVQYTEWPDTQPGRSLIAGYKYNSSGKLTSEFNFYYSLNVTSYFYGSANKLSCVLIMNEKGDTVSTEDFIYDAWFRKTEMKHRNFAEPKYSAVFRYDTLGNLTSRQTYSAGGKLLGSEEKIVGPGNRLLHWISRDEKNKMTSHMKLLYDPNGNCVLEIDSGFNNRRSYEYDYLFNRWRTVRYRNSRKGFSEIIRYKYKMEADSTLIEEQTSYFKLTGWKGLFRKYRTKSEIYYDKAGRRKHEKNTRSKGHTDIISYENGIPVKELYIEKSKDTTLVKTYKFGKNGLLLEEKSTRMDNIHDEKKKNYSGKVTVEEITEYEYTFYRKD